MEDRQMFVGQSEEELRAWLEAAGVSTAAWGQGAAKSVALLLEECIEGESQLLTAEDGSARRVVSVLNVVIRNSRGQVLTEAAQVLPTGARRPRNLVLAEKLLPGEDWRAAVERAIREELGPVLPGEPRQIDIDAASYQQDVEQRGSQSYPGLLSKYICHRVAASVPGLPDQDFTTDEQRSDGMLTHIWEWR